MHFPPVFRIDEIHVIENVPHTHDPQFPGYFFRHNMCIEIIPPV